MQGISLCAKICGQAGLHGQVLRTMSGGEPSSIKQSAFRDAGSLFARILWLTKCALHFS